MAMMVSFVLLLCAVLRVRIIECLLSPSPVTLGCISHQNKARNKELHTTGYFTNSRKAIVDRKDTTSHRWKFPSTTAMASVPFSSDEELFVALYREKESNKSTESSYHATDLNNNDHGNDKEETRDCVTAGPSLPSDECDIGACVPNPTLQPEEIVPLLMKALQNVDHPTVDNGLITVWEFTTDTTKFIFQNNRTEFIESCHETARDFPTSFYGAAMTGRSWTIETELNRVGGDTGWIATQVTSTISSDGRRRRWQWELRKNKRPPCLGCWRVENIASSDRKGNFEPD